MRMGFSLVPHLSWDEGVDNKIDKMAVERGTALSENA
jgi:hypothetical protein